MTRCRPQLTPRRLSGGRGQGTALVLDDEDYVRTFAEDILERFGFQVLSADDGREGVATFREHADKISLVLLDMAMPNMAGDEAYRLIRQISRDVPIVLSSGFTRQDAAKSLRESKYTVFLQKPYRVKQLRATLRQLLD